jgi:N-acetylmuramoyl-L-alanine amidase
MGTPSAVRAIRTLLSLVLLLSPIAVIAGEIQAVRVWAGPDYTRVVFDVSEPLDYKLFGLADPDRIVIDFRATRMANSASEVQPRGLLGGIRSGAREKSDLRVVFDLTGKSRPKSFLLQPAENFGYRLVVDLYPEQAKAPARRVEDLVQTRDRDVVVAIDAGHGGEDPGAIGPGGTREKNVTLAIAKELARLIDAEPGMRAELIRTGDYFLPHRQRYMRAREARADLFVSIHADAFTNRAANGSSVYILSPRGASSEAARWLAERENRADLVGGVSLDDKDDTLAAVLLDLSQGATLEASNRAAEAVLSGLSRVGKTHKRYVERANFMVLRSPDVPSLLIETAFISNPDDERRLRDPAHQRRLAAAVVDGVREFFIKAPPPGTWYAAHQDAEPLRHVVSRGETLTHIARRHRVSISAIRAANNLNSDLVKVGDVLRIPVVTSG